MQCATHRDTETFLRCGKCETPICPRCTVQTPVGARCRECASTRSSPVFQASSRQYALALLAALAAGLVLGWLPRLLILLGPILYGYVVGEATLRGGGRRRGPGMQVIAGLGALFGMLFWMLGGPGRIGWVLSNLSFSQFLGLLANPFSLIALGLGIALAVIHVRSI
jgi:hypothetical protein